MSHPILNDIEEISAALLSLLREQSKLFFLEARLAKQSIAPFAIVLFLIVFVTLTLWLGTELLVGLILHHFINSIILSLIITLFLNLLALVLLLYLLMGYKNNMAFSETLRNIKSIVNKEHE